MIKKMRRCFITILLVMLISVNTEAQYTRPIIRSSLLSWSSWHAYCCIINREDKEYTTIINKEVPNVLKAAKQNKKWATKTVKKLKLNKMKDKKAVNCICEYIEDTYDYDSREGWLEGAIKKKRANCTAYADLFYVLCKASKIPVRYIRGTAKGSYTSSHCWNQVKINKKWYWVDTCWGYRPRQKLWKDHCGIIEVW